MFYKILNVLSTVCSYWCSVKRQDVLSSFPVVWCNPTFQSQLPHPSFCSRDLSSEVCFQWLIFIPHSLSLPFIMPHKTDKRTLESDSPSCQSLTCFNLTCLDSIKVAWGQYREVVEADCNVKMRGSWNDPMSHLFVVNANSLPADDQIRLKTLNISHNALLQDEQSYPTSCFFKQLKVYSRLCRK